MIEQNNSLQKKLLLEKLLQPFKAKEKYLTQELTKYLPTSMVKKYIVELYGYNDPNKTKKIILAQISDNKEEISQVLDKYSDNCYTQAFIYNYLCKLLNCLKDTNEFKQAIPSYYHQYVPYIHLKGIKPLKEIYNADCYSSMETIILSNILLGINNES